MTSSGISPADHEQIFSLVYTRLSSLTLCNATPFAAQEVKALEDLNSSYYRDEETGIHLVPWELRVLAVRLQGMGFTDARRGIMGYYDLARECRLSLTPLKKTLLTPSSSDALTSEERSVLEQEITLLTARLSDLGIRVASALIEMEDLEGAARHLKSLSLTKTPDANLRIQKALLFLYLGDIDAAKSCISSPEGCSEEKVVLALAHMGDSQYEAAVLLWEDLIASAVEKGNSDISMYRNNLAVCNLYLGHLDSAREVLEILIENGNSFHALTFNLSTIYELCTERSRALKIEMAEKVSEIQTELSKGGAGTDGLNEGRVGWEKVNGDFKL